MTDVFELREIAAGIERADNIQLFPPELYGNLRMLLVDWRAKDSEIERLTGELDDAKHRAGIAELNYGAACAASERENERLKKILRPFASVAEYEDDRSDPDITRELDDDDEYWSVFYRGLVAKHFRAARDALNDTISSGPIAIQR